MIPLEQGVSGRSPPYSLRSDKLVGKTGSSLCLTGFRSRQKLIDDIAIEVPRFYQKFAIRYYSSSLANWCSLILSRGKND